MMKKIFLVVIVCLFAMTSIWAGSQPQRAGAGGREIFELDIYTHQSGTYTYIFGVAMAEILNEAHPWIRAVAVEGISASANELMIYEADDNVRRHTLFFGVGDSAWRGSGPFEGKQTTRSKIAFNYGLILSALVTTNPSVNRVEDFTNRALSLRSGPSNLSPYFINLIDSRAQNVRYERLDFNRAAESSLSGTIDGWFPLFYSIEPDLREWRGNPATVEFLARARHVGFIDLPLEESRILRSTRGGPFEDFFNVMVTVPARALDPRQTRPVVGAMSNGIFMVDQVFSGDMLLEIMKTVGESREKLMNFHPQGAYVTPETMAIYTWPTEFHPGAISYFNSVGVRPVFLGDLTP